MFPHEEFLKKALEECQITKLVQDLGALYVSTVNAHGDEDDFLLALSVNRILDEAAGKIADLGPKPIIPHPMDKSPFRKE
jgi:hypothetical protein